MISELAFLKAVGPVFRDFLSGIAASCWKCFLSFVHVNLTVSVHLLFLVLFVFPFLFPHPHWEETTTLCALVYFLVYEITCSLEVDSCPTLSIGNSRYSFTDNEYGEGYRGKKSLSSIWTHFCWVTILTLLPTNKSGWNLGVLFWSPESSSNLQSLILIIKVKFIEQTKQNRTNKTTTKFNWIPCCLNSKI